MSNHNIADAGPIIEVAEKISDGLDSIIALVNTLRMNLLMQIDTCSFNELEEILETTWEPLQENIITFQSSIKTSTNSLMKTKGKKMLINPTRSVDTPTSNENDEKSDTKRLSSGNSPRSSRSKSFSQTSDDYNDTIELPDFSLKSEGSDFTDATTKSPTESSLEFVHGKSSVGIEEFEILDLLTSLERNLSPSSTHGDLESEKTVSKPEEGDLARTRGLIIADFFAKEKAYFDILYILRMFQTALTAEIETDSSIMSMTDCKKIFGKIDMICKFHTSWLELLEHKHKTKDDLSCVAQFFTALSEELVVYKEHSNVLHICIETLHKYRNNKKVFDIVPKDINMPNLKLGIEDALGKPIIKISEYFCLLDDLIKHTPESDPNYSVLVSSRDEMGIFFEVIKSNARDKKPTRQVVKWAPIVERSPKGERKQRLLIISTDYIMCATEQSRGSAVAKWYSHIKRISLTPPEGYEEKNKELCVPTPKVHIDALREEIRNLREEIKLESSKKHNSRKIEKLEKALFEKEAELSLKFPSHVLKIFVSNGKSYTLLFNSDKIRDKWKSVMDSRIKSKLIEEWPLTQNEVQQTLDSIIKYYHHEAFKGTPKEEVMPSATISASSKNEKAGDGKNLNGKIFVGVSVSRSDNSPGDIICHLELDKHLKNALKFKLKPIKSNDTSYKDLMSFDVEKCTSYLYVTFVRMKGRAEENVGGFAFNLFGESITSKPYIRTVKYFKWGKIAVFAEFSQSLLTPKYVGNYNPFRSTLTESAESEALEIPSLISLCIQAVEKRGLEEIGIYRLSGVASVIGQIKLYWKLGLISDETHLENIDIHVIAGVFKSYLRDLAEPVVTAAVFNKLVDWCNEKPDDFEALENILQQLPKANYISFKKIMEHLVKVASLSKVNKMTPENLGTVFGLNLFRTNLGDASGGNSSTEFFTPINTFMAVLRHFCK